MASFELQRTTAFFEMCLDMRGSRTYRSGDTAPSCADVISRLDGDIVLKGPFPASPAERQRRFPAPCHGKVQLSRSDRLAATPLEGKLTIRA